MTNREAAEALSELKETDIIRDLHMDPEMFDLAIQALGECEYDEGKILKRRHGEYVTYRIDYLLKNLAREIYLLESYRKWKEADNDE